MISPAKLREIVPEVHVPINEEHTSVDPPVEVVVHIVDDDAVVRKSLEVLIRSAGYRTIGHDSGEAFLETFSSDIPAVLVLDQRLPGMTGSELHARLERMGVCPPTVFLSAHNSVRDAVRFLEQGAVTVLCKPCQGQELLGAITRAVRKEQQNARQRMLGKDLAVRLAGLTSQERKVVSMMVEGLQNKQIASRLEVSLRTVENRRHNIFQKTKTSNLAELVRLVVAHSLLNEEAEREIA